MAQVTLRDLASNEDIIVPQEGYIFGRVGGDADIQIEDNSISRRQARVSFKNGRWLLETLAVPQGSRAPKPVALAEGATFAIGESEFEVVAVDEEDGEVDPQARTFAPTKSKPAPSGKPEKAAAPAPKRAPTAQVAKGDDEAPPADFKAMFVAVPKGIAYYLVNVPKLLVNPIGTVRTTIETLPAEAMGRIELIGYALPALLATALLGSISGGIATLIRGGGFDLLAFIPIIPAVASVIGAIITGFIFHPVLEWIVTKLKGESDARSRTNYFLQTMTLSVLLAVPSALGNILSALPVPFINLLGPLLGVAATLVSLYVTFQWFVFFDVVKWFRMVVLGLGGVMVLLGLLGFVNGIIATVRGSGSTTVATGAGDTAVPEGTEPPTTDAPESVAAALQAKADALNKAQQRIDDAQQADAKAKDDPKKDPKGDKPDKVEKVVEAPPTKPEKPVEVAVVATPDPEPTVEPTREPTREPPSAAGSPYEAFARKRDTIEKLFESDPTVLAKSRDLQRLYAEYLESAWDLDRKYGKENSKHPERRKLNAHLRDAELFGKAGKTIDVLASKLGIR